MAVVGKASELRPGQIIAVDVDGEPVAIANVEGKFFAVSDICTHRGCLISEGDLVGNVITCHCHGGQYDIKSGEVLQGPPPLPLKSYEVSVLGDNLVIV